MKEVNANLKAMSQWPALWALFGVLGLIELCLASSAADHLSNDPSGYTGAWWVLSSLVLGLSISAVQMSFAGKTLAFMLPGHEVGVRQVLLGTGPIIIGLFSLVFLSYPDLSQAALVGLYLSAFCLGMFFYWLGVGVVLVWGMKYVAILLIIGVFIFSVGRWIEWFIIELPILSIILGTVATGVFWWLLRQPEFFKQYCRETWYSSAAIAASKRRQPIFREEMTLPARRSRLEIITEQFFLKRMQSCKSSGMARYLWGQLYEMLGMISSRYQLIKAVLYIVPNLFFGYLVVDLDGHLLPYPWIMVPFMLVGRFENKYSSLLITGGRYERFVAVLANTVVVVVLTTVFYLFICILSLPLEWVLPKFDLFVYHSFPTQYFWLPGFMAPLNSAMLLLFRKFHWLGNMIGTLACLVVVFWLYNPLDEFPDSSLMIWAISLTCASWLILVGVSWYVCRKWSLVRTGSTW
jgi:hypothetical protein